MLRAHEWLAICLALGLSACGDTRPGPSHAVEPDPVSEALPRFRSKAPQEPLAPETDRALGLIAAGEYAEARSALEGVVRRAPAAGRPRFLIGFTHHKQKHYAEARPHFEAVLETGPTFDRASSVFYFYAWCLWYLGEVEGAGRAFEAALELDPEERDAHYGLGLVALEQGRTADAESRFAESIRLAQAARAPRDVAKAKARLSDVALARNDAAGARALLEESLELNPEGYEAWFKLSRVLTRLGDERAAAQALLEHRKWKRRAGR